MRTEDLGLELAGLVVTGDLGVSTERAEFYNQVADEAEGSEATTFTNDRVYAAAARLCEVLGVQLRNADTIRGRLQRREVRGERRSRWVRRLVRLR